MNNEVRYSKVIRIDNTDYWSCVICNKWSKGNLYSCGWQYCSHCGAYPVRDAEIEMKFQQRIQIMERGLNMLTNMGCAKK